MSDTSSHDFAYGIFSEDSTLTLQRTLPGPIERVWSYLVDSDLRRQWLAAGAMDLRPGTSFDLVWRNDELSASPNERPAGFPEESRATCRMTEIEPPRKLRFTWPNVGDVTIVLEPLGEDVLLTLTHRGLGEKSMKVMVAAGWHTHLDILIARLNDRAPVSFWAAWRKLKEVYDRRLSD